MSGIFISYRRDDSEGWVTGLAHTLRESFGDDQVFRDIDTLSPGLSYTQAIEQRLARCDVVLVIIGPRWLTATNKAGRRRLDDRRDLARLEVASALRRNIPVIPVLVGRTSMPVAEELPDDLQELTCRQAYDLSDRRWDYDLEELIRILEGSAYLGRPAVHATAPGVSGPASKHARVQGGGEAKAAVGVDGVNSGSAHPNVNTNRVRSYLIHTIAGFAVFFISAGLVSILADVILPFHAQMKDMIIVAVLSVLLYVLFGFLVKLIDKFCGERSFKHLLSLVSLPIIFMLIVMLDGTADTKLPSLVLLVALICMPFVLKRRKVLVDAKATTLGST